MSEAARYSLMRWNAPLSPAHAEELLDGLDLDGQPVLDLGCGWGELLLAAAVRGVRGVGVDQDEALLTRGRSAAKERGLDVRVQFLNADLVAWCDASPRVICIGAEHAFGSAQEALAALRRVTEPGGRLLFGASHWSTAPTRAALDIFGSGLLLLPDLVAAARASGWRVLMISCANQREWDLFESSYRLGRELWLVDHPTDPEAGAVRSALDRSLEEYLTGYRGIIWFAYLTLLRPI